jgi:hypothetical protein
VQKGKSHQAGAWSPWLTAIPLGTWGIGGSEIPALPLNLPPRREIRLGRKLLGAAYLAHHVRRPRLNGYSGEYGCRDGYLLHRSVFDCVGVIMVVDDVHVSHSIPLGQP